LLARRIPTSLTAAQRRLPTARENFEVGFDTLGAALLPWGWEMHLNQGFELLATAELASGNALLVKPAVARGLAGRSLTGG
jgi:hypothetical protein